MSASPTFIPLVLPLVVLALPCLAIAGPRDDAAAESLGWHLALQCWTFNDVTAFEAIDRAKGMGLRYLELYPGQPLRSGSDVKVHHDMSAADRDALAARLREAGIKPVNYGVVELTGKEDADRKVFEFAKALGIETINSEPAPEQLAAIEKLANEYKINVALHNHPKPSRYWNPETAYAAVRSHGPRLGLCADVGHWMRSGIDPLAALQKYGDRVITFHFKDLNEFGQPEAHDVPWGTGAGQTAALLKLLRDQKFKGVFSIEYEIHPADQLAQVAQCVARFDQIASDLARKEPAAPAAQKPTTQKPVNDGK